MPARRSLCAPFADCFLFDFIKAVLTKHEFLFFLKNQRLLFGGQTKTTVRGFLINAMSSMILLFYHLI